jgi:hypothetical protein
MRREGHVEATVEAAEISEHALIAAADALGGKSSNGQCSRFEAPRPPASSLLFHTSIQYVEGV